MALLPQWGQAMVSVVWTRGLCPISGRSTAVVYELRGSLGRMRKDPSSVYS